MRGCGLVGLSSGTGGTEPRQLRPACQYAIERVHDAQVPHADARLFPHQAHRFGPGEGLAVGAIGGQRVVHVGDAEAAQGQGDGVPLEAVRIGAAVEALVVAAGECAGGVWARGGRRVRARGGSAARGSVRRWRGPAAVPWVRSAGATSPVTRTGGTRWVLSSALRRRQASKPVMRGMETSMRMRSGG